MHTLSLEFGVFGGTVCSYILNESIEKRFEVCLTVVLCCTFEAELPIIIEGSPRLQSVVGSSAT